MPGGQNDGTEEVSVQRIANTHYPCAVGLVAHQELPH